MDFGRKEYGYRASWRGGLAALQEPTLTVLLVLPNKPPMKPNPTPHETTVVAAPGRDHPWLAISTVVAAENRPKDAAQQSEICVKFSVFHTVFDVKFW